MSSANPPYPYYDGIPFNPSFFTSDTGTGSGLTETEANALYLRKTVTDTASALETFNGGIVTPSLSSASILNIDGGVINIANTLDNASEVYIMNNDNASGVINIMSSNSSTGYIALGGANTETAINGITIIPLINTSPPSNNLTQITLGATNGAFDTNTTMNGKTTISKLNAPLNPVFTYPILTATHIGYNIYDPVVGTTLAANDYNNITNFITLTAGVWLINYGVKATSTADSSITIYTIWGNETADATIFYSQNGISEKIVSTRELIFTGTFVVVSTGTNTYQIKSYSGYTGGTLTIIKSPSAEYSYVKRTRIA